MQINGRYAKQDRSLIDQVPYSLLSTKLDTLSYESDTKYTYTHVYICVMYMYVHVGEIKIHQLPYVCSKSTCRMFTKIFHC